MWSLSAVFRFSFTLELSKSYIRARVGWVLLWEVLVRVSGLMCEEPISRLSSQSMLRLLVQGHPLRATEPVIWQVDMIRMSKHLESSEAHSRTYGELFSGLVAME